MALAAGSAFAADLPNRKAPPYIPPPPPPLWTGFYVGLNAGGTFGGNNSVTLSAAPVFQSCAGSAAHSAELSPALRRAATAFPAASSGGFIGGGQIGYNWQFSNVFVAGIEADIQGIAAAISDVGHRWRLAVSGFRRQSSRQLTRSARASTISAPCAAASAGSSRRPCSPTARAVSLMAASIVKRQHFPDTSTSASSDPPASRRQLLRHARWLDGRRRRRMDVLAELERQGRISLLRSRQCDVRSQPPWRNLAVADSLHCLSILTGHDALQRPHRPRRRELSLQLGRSCSGRREILIDHASV